MVKERIEDYLLAIYKYQIIRGYARTSEIARELGVKDATVTKVLRNLEGKALVSVNHYHGAALTSEGRRIASKILRKHRIIELFLNKVLGFDPFKSHALAHYMEHLPDEIINSIYKLLQNPDTCITEEGYESLTLSNASEGKCYQVICLITELKDVIEKLRKAKCWVCSKIRVIGKGKSGLTVETDMGEKLILTLDESKSIAVKEVSCDSFTNPAIPGSFREEGKGS